MAFIVEDGTGKVDSTSYVDVSFADAYFGDQLEEGWLGIVATDSHTADEIKQSCLIRATTYLDSFYRFRGSRASSTQSLQWPRINVDTTELIDTSGVPIEVQKATAELALMASTSTLYRTADNNANKVKKLTEKVEGISRTIEYAGYGEVKEIPLYPQVDALLEPLIIDYRTGGSSPAAILTGTSTTTMQNVRSNPDRPSSAFVNGTWDNPPFSKRTLPW